MIGGHEVYVIEIHICMKLRDKEWTNLATPLSGHLILLPAGPAAHLDQLPITSSCSNKNSCPPHNLDFALSSCLPFHGGFHPPEFTAHDQRQDLAVWSRKHGYEAQVVARSGSSGCSSTEGTVQVVLPVLVAQTAVQVVLPPTWRHSIRWSPASPQCSQAALKRVIKGERAALLI